MKSFLVTLEKNALNCAESEEKVRSELERLGFRPKEEHSRLSRYGIIVGTAPEGFVELAEQIKGVRSVEEDRRRGILR